nr:MAG TPA: protein of unknown function (DUF2112) [Caudoviricetes sp.]
MPGVESIETPPGLRGRCTLIYLIIIGRLC